MDISVVIPTRNELHNVPTLLRSIPAGIRLVVVDSSEDGTTDLIAALRPTNLTIVRYPCAISEARQIGAELAHTQWLVFSDADVFFAPNYFEHLAQCLGSHVDALYGPKLSSSGYQRYYNWMARGQAWSQRLGIPAVSGSNLVVRRASLTVAGGFDTQLKCNEDSEMGWRLKRRGHRVVFDPDLVVYARDHRRLERGATRKTLHSLARCTLLYLNVIPKQLRGRDWGYWANVRERGDFLPKA